MGTRAVGNGGVYHFDQATLSLIIISTNRYKEAVINGQTTIKKIHDEIKDSNIMDSSVGNVVLNEVSSMCKSFDALVKTQQDVTALLDYYIQKHADTSDLAKAQAQAAGVADKAKGLTRKQ